MREANRLILEWSLIEDSSITIDDPEEEAAISVPCLENLTEIHRWLWRMLSRRPDSMTGAHPFLVNRCIHGHLIVGVGGDEISIAIEHIEVNGGTVHLLSDLAGTHRMMVHGLNGSDLIRECG